MNTKNKTQDACDFLQSAWNLIPRKQRGFEVFHLGYGCDRLTVHTQQKRALNLAWIMNALRDKDASLSQQELKQKLKLNGGRLEKMGNVRKICVIGGGVAGMTFAAAAALSGREVFLLEKHSELLPLQRGNLTRWLHPNVYDWPDEISKEPDAGLPVLNWCSGSAGQVMEGLVSQWNELVEIDRIPVRVRLEVQKTQFGQNYVVVTHKEGVETIFDVDAVVLAVGYGLERHVNDEPVVSYWKDDPLHQHGTRFRAGERRRRVLVAGTGDGGLVDCLRLSLRDFKHTSMIESFRLNEMASGTLMKKLKEIMEGRRENDKKSEPPKSAAWQFDQYEQLLRAPEKDLILELERIDERIKARLREDTDVTLLGRSAYPFDHKSSLLNSFLVWRLVRMGHVRHLSGELATGWQRRDTSWRVDIKSTKGTSAESGETLEFDHLVVRLGLGPNPYDEFADLMEVVKSPKEWMKNMGWRKVWKERRQDTVKQLFERGSFPRIHQSIIDQDRAVEWLKVLGFTEHSKLLLDHQLAPVPSAALPRATNLTSWGSEALEKMLLQAKKLQKPSVENKSVIFLEGAIGAGKSVLALRYVADHPNSLFLDFGATVRYGPEARRQFVPGSMMRSHLEQYLEKREKAPSGVDTPLTVFLDGLDLYAAYRANLTGAKELYSLFNEEVGHVIKLLPEEGRWNLVVIVDAYHDDKAGLHERLWANLEAPILFNEARIRAAQTRTTWLNTIQVSKTVIDKARAKAAWASSALISSALSNTTRINKARQFNYAARIRLARWCFSPVSLKDYPQEFMPPVGERAICWDTERLQSTEKLMDRCSPSANKKQTPLYDALSSYSDGLIEKLGYRKHRLLKCHAWYRDLRAKLPRLARLKTPKEEKKEKQPWFPDSPELFQLLDAFHEVLKTECSWDDDLLISEDIKNDDEMGEGWKALHLGMLESPTRVLLYGQGFLFTNLVTFLNNAGLLEDDNAWPDPEKKVYQRCSLEGADLRGITEITFIECDMSRVFMDKECAERNRFKDCRSWHSIHMEHGVELPAGIQLMDSVKPAQSRTT